MPKEPKGQDELEVEPDSGYIPRSLRPQVAIPKTTRERWHDEVKNLFRPSRNGYNDSLSHLLLIDTLMRLKPDQIIRAGKLRDLLAKNSPQLIWDSVTVGRMLTELSDIAGEDAKKGQKPHITQARDRYGAYFLISYGPDTYQWLADLRTVAANHFQDELEYLQKGLQPATRAFSVYEATRKLGIGIGAAALMLLPEQGPANDIATAILQLLGVR